MSGQYSESPAYGEEEVPEMFESDYFRRWNKHCIVVIEDIVVIRIDVLGSKYACLGGKISKERAF